MGDVEILPRVERRRKWTEEEKAALLAEVEAEGGKVSVVARRHRVAESLLYNWRAPARRRDDARRSRWRSSRLALSDAPMTAVRPCWRRHQPLGQNRRISGARTIGLG